MKKAATKKTTSPTPETTAVPAPVAAPATLTGIANRHFRSPQGFHALGSTVTLTGDDIARYGHFLSR
jgi:hypothetical protein